LILKKERQKQKEDQGRLNLVVFKPYSGLFCFLNLAVKVFFHLPGILLD